MTSPPGLPALPKIDIRVFRGIRRLTVPRLERVNLFVGKNNAGKTSLLDAIRLYSAMGEPRTLLQLLVERDGLAWSSVRANNVDAISTALAHLFLETSRESSNFIEFEAEDTAYPHLGLSRIEVHLDERGEPVFGSGLGGRESLSVEVGESEVTIALDQLAAINVWKARTRKCVFIGPHGTSPAQLAAMWDGVVLTEGEEQVLGGLRLLVPDAERISFVQDPERPGVRIPMVKLVGSIFPVRLSTFGDGTVRVFGLMLALVNAHSGTLLVDEIENGLHHSVQEEVWKVLFERAEELDVQVFATTHSWDAVVAFQEAANQSPAVGILYRLERGNDGVVYAETYSEQDLAIAAEQQVEVR